jgi:hypothetical protein
MWIALMRLTINKDVVSLRKKSSKIDLSDPNEARDHSEGGNRGFNLDNPNNSKGQ